MKKTFITCLALLAISLCLFVSCSAENTAVNEMNDVAYVTFGRDSRDFSASYLVQSYDELYWFYTAKKADNYGTTGATTGLTKAPSKGNGKGIGSGTVGPFSQGKWTFTLSAYASLNGNTPDESTCVYESKEIIVTLKGGETKAIPVTVSPVGETGLIKFKDAYFQYKDGGEEASKFMIRAVGKSATYELSNDEDYITSHDGTIRIRLTKNGNEYIIAFVEQDGKLSNSISAPVDYYTCTAYAYLPDSTTPLATCTFGLSVYGNATTVVSGRLLENPNSKVSFDVAASDIKTFLGSNTEKKVEVKVAPVSGQSTTVDFTNANNIDNNATYAVNVEALSANAANDAFQFSNITEKGKETLGSVKLSLTQIKDGIATDVKEFGEDGGYVTVSTYIGEGLASDSISVVYNGDGAAPVFNGDGLGYDSKTGIITFRTNHFSEFFIVRDGNVYNKNQNRYYYSLEDAINKANTNETIVLQKPLKIEKTISINKDINIDLGGNNNGITSDSSRVFLIIDGTTTIDNGAITSTLNVDLVENTNYSTSSTIRVSSNDSSNANPRLIIEKDATIKAGNSYGVGAFGKSASAAVDVYGTIEAYYSALAGNGSLDWQNQDVEFNVYEESKLISKASSAIYQPNNGVTNIFGGSIEGNSAIEIRSGKLNIESGVLKSNASKYEVVSNKSGSTTEGAAIAIAQHTTRLPINVNIVGGEFSGVVAFSEKDPQDGEAKDITINITGGKFTSTDKSENKQTVVSDDIKGFISGGEFDNKPADDYIADGYFYSNGKIAKVQGTVNVNGEEIKIANISDVADIESKNITVDVEKDSSLTLDNGFFNEENNNGNSKDISLIGKLDSNDNPVSTVDVITNAVTAEGGELNYQRGSSFSFENLTIQAGEGDFDGIVCDELVYKNCTIKGKLTLYGKATFINCTFENEMGDQYSIWTWGGTDVKFENCTFNTNGKAILLYGQATESKPTNLVVNNCVFNDRNNGTAGKAAIEIGNDYNATYTLTVTNATVNGFAKGKNTDSKLWANKNSMDAEHLTVTIDGTKIQ